MTARRMGTAPRAVPAKRDKRTAAVGTVVRLLQARTVRRTLMAQGERAGVDLVAVEQAWEELAWEEASISPQWTTTLSAKVMWIARTPSTGNV